MCFVVRSLIRSCRAPRDECPQRSGQESATVVVDVVDHVESPEREAERLDARSEKRENRGTQTGHAFARNQDRSSQDIRIDSIQHIILLRNTAGIDYSLDVNSMTGHAVQNHSSMKSGSFNSGEQLVLRGTLQIPTKRHAT